MCEGGPDWAALGALCLLDGQGAAVGAHNQYVFKVRTDATKLEIKKAVEMLLGVKVEAVNTVLIKGKTKGFGRTPGRRADIKKAYVTLPAGTEVQLADVAE